MQYLLTEEEYQRLLDAPKKVEEEYKAKLQKVCTLAADKIPVNISWLKDRNFTPEPWQCIHSVEEEHYCDECPVKQHCPSGKHHSK